MGDFSAQQMIDCLNGLFPGPDAINALDGIASPDPASGLGEGRNTRYEHIELLQQGIVDLGSMRTRGLQLPARMRFDLGRWGQLGSQLRLGHVAELRIDSGADLLGNPSRLRTRVSWETHWTTGDFDFAWTVHHIDSTRSTQAQQIIDCNRNARCFGVPDYGYALRLPSWTTHDLQASWDTPWNGRLSLGVQNAANKGPVLDPLEPGGRGFDFNLYDGYGRVPYLRYRQSF